MKRQIPSSAVPIKSIPNQSKSSTASKSPAAKVQKEVAEMFNNMVVSNAKREPAKSKKARTLKPVKRQNRRGVGAVAIAQENAESSDDDFEAEMAAAKTRKKPETIIPEVKKDEDEV